MTARLRSARCSSEASRAESIPEQRDEARELCAAQRWSGAGLECDVAADHARDRRALRVARDAERGLIVAVTVAMREERVAVAIEARDDDVVGARAVAGERAGAEIKAVRADPVDDARGDRDV